MAAIIMPAVPDLLLLSRADVESLLDLDLLLDSLAVAFQDLSAGKVSVPPRSAAVVPGRGLLGVMPGYLPSAGLEVKLVSVFPANHDRGLPSHQALIALFDPETGTPLALMDGTHITAIRTAAAAGLATRVLANEDAVTVAILGAGVQGRAHLQVLPRVRSFRAIRIASRDPQHAQALAAGHPNATPAGSFEEAVRGADVVCLCTHSAQPITRREWFQPGVHVNSVGSNPEGPELDGETVAAARLVVESRVAFQPPPAGAAELRGLDPNRAAELGEVLLGTRPGRQGRDEITVYKSMGHAVEDAAAAGLVHDLARARGVGQLVSI